MSRVQREQQNIRRGDCATTMPLMQARSYRKNFRTHGVASVLAMMFLVLFGSLAAAMAVVAHGNMRTADSNLRVSRALSAAETGLVFAGHRLEAETRRFVVQKGIIDAGFAERLWMGTYNADDGQVTVLPPTGYAVHGPDPAGIIYALRHAHLADSHSFIAEPADAALPHINTEYGSLQVRPIALTAKANGSPDPEGPYFRLRYELLMNGNVRITSTGIDRGITRTISMDFRITKKIEYAVLSVNRIMVGKNVLVEGPLGSRFGTEPGELESDLGHPLITRSDFYYLDPALNDKLDVFFDRVAEFDVDGDGRLRPHHPKESTGLQGTEFIDYTGDGYVDDFDIFLQHYDADGDGMVVYDADLAAAAGHGSLAVEFTMDPQLARLIDRAHADRDGDGEITFADTQLGYKDGVLDYRDRYAKVRGRLGFAIARSDWEAAQGGQSYQRFVQGPILPGRDNPAVQFEVPVEEMLEITTEMFSESQSTFLNMANGMSFEDQVSAGGGEVIMPGDPTHPGWEEVPYGSASPYEFYERPIYRNMTFKNVVIPRGTNALFENCTFIGVTFIDTEPNTTHYNWNIAGAIDRIAQDDGTVKYEPKWPGLNAELDGAEVSDSREHSNNIRFHDCTFLGSVTGVRPEQYTHWRNKVQMTGETRFYIDVEDVDLQTQPDAEQLTGHLNSLTPNDIEELKKSSILMPGWSMDVGSFTSDASADPEDLPTIKLKGTIVAGILDIRGNADVHGTLLMTFRPEIGKQPLLFVPPGCYTCLTNFSTTLGYFGPDWGDKEALSPGDPGFEGFGEIIVRYDPDAKLPDGIPWPVRAEAMPPTYREGGGL